MFKSDVKTNFLEENKESFTMNQNTDPLTFDQDFQLLIDIANNTEKIRKRFFDMSVYLTDCGTTGCMIGHFAMKYGYDRKSNFNYVKDINDNLYLSDKEWAFLFSGYKMHFGRDNHLLHKIQSISATPNDPLLAAKRLRKYIYYKLHKREMLGDRSTKEGREKYEMARKKEGNHNFVKQSIMSLV